VQGGTKAPLTYIFASCEYSKGLSHKQPGKALKANHFGLTEGDWKQQKEDNSITSFALSVPGRARLLLPGFLWIVEREGEYWRSCPSLRQQEQSGLISQALPFSSHATTSDVHQLMKKIALPSTVHFL